MDIKAQEQKSGEVSIFPKPRPELADQEDRQHLRTAIKLALVRVKNLDLGWI